MTRSRIYLSPPHLGQAEVNNVRAAIDSNWVAPIGPFVDAFEEDILTYTGAEAAAVLSSGTAAIHLALLLAGVQAGDVVLCSTFTFIATANPITYVGGSPVFIDSEKDTWNMSPDLLKEAIEHQIRLGKKPKACILVHLYGMPAKIEEIKQLCDTNDIVLIEDAAEALGSRYKQRHLGTIGTYGVYSFNGNKIITTSGGGCLVSKGEQVERAKFLSTQARDQALHYQHSVVGYNYRMSNILAAIGSGQMKILDQRVEGKRAIQQWYRYILSDYSYVEVQHELSGDYYSNYWLTTIRFDSEHKHLISKLLNAFNEANIEARPLWKPLHLQPVFQNCLSFVDGTSEDLFNHGVCLPSGTAMTDNDKARIQAVLNAVLD